jgi:hypothetical protein
LNALLLVTAVSAMPTRMEVRLYATNESQLIARLGSRLTELDVCSHGTAPDGRFFLIVNTDTEHLQTIRELGIEAEVTWPDIRDKFRAMTGCNPDDGSFRDFGYFFNYWEMRDTILHLAANYPQILVIDSSMHSWQQKHQYCLKVSDNPGLDEREPQVFINGAIHAREPMTTHTCVTFAALLCQGYNRDSAITWLVNNREIFIVPVQNPDGYVYNSDSGGTSANWRKTRHVIQSPSVGIDLNRNYGYKWAYDNVNSSPNPSSEVYRGPSRFSEPESDNFRALQAAHRFRTEMDFHTYGRSNMYPWGYAAVTPPDAAVLQEMGDSLAHYNGYSTAQASGVNGVSFDWEYSDTLWNGVRKFVTYAFTSELGITDFWYGSSNPAYVDSEVARNTPNCFYLTRVAGVFLTPGAMVVNDSASGNADGRLDPGESASLWFVVRNGACHPLDTAKGVSAVLVPSDTMVQVLTPVASFPDIPRHRVAGNGSSQFQVFCSPNAVSGDTIRLRLEVTFSDDSVAIMQPVDYRLVIGSHPTAVAELGVARKPGLTVLTSPSPGKVRFRGPAGPGLRVSILNNDGRLVRVLPAAGAFEWDGRDGQGRASPDGVYFARLTPDSAPGVRFILVR